MLKWLKGKKTYLMAALKLLAGIAVAVFVPEPYAKTAGGLVAVDALKDMALRAGVESKIDEEKVVGRIIYKLGKYFDKKK
jgi:hypothetical protein